MIQISLQNRAKTAMRRTQLDLMGMHLFAKRPYWQIVNNMIKTQVDNLNLFDDAQQVYVM